MRFTRSNHDRTKLLSILIDEASIENYGIRFRVVLERWKRCLDRGPESSSNSIRGRTHRTSRIANGNIRFYGIPLVQRLIEISTKVKSDAIEKLSRVISKQRVAFRRNEETICSNNSTRDDRDNDTITTFKRFNVQIKNDILPRRLHRWVKRVVRAPNGKRDTRTVYFSSR